MPRIDGLNYSDVPTGAYQHYSGVTAPTGWVFADGRTLGSASSGATNHANADALNLYTVLWNNFANAQLPVSGGRGVSAAADFAANKTITIPDLRGRALFGLDNMGGTAANRITLISGTTNGAGGGSQTVSVATTVTRAGWGTQGGALGAVTAGWIVTGSGTPEEVETLESIRSSAVDQSFGGSGANLPPTTICTIMLKL